MTIPIKSLLTVTAALLLAFVSFAQKSYKPLMTDITVNFYEVCAEAEKYFETHDKNLKGSGWKGYQRWKNANEYKFYPSGDRSNIDPFFAENAYRRFIKNNPVSYAKNDYPYGWEEIGPTTLDSATGHYSMGLGRINDHYTNPLNDDQMYVGSRSGGFWKTSDGGNNWTCTTDFLVATGVDGIAVSPTNSDSILINVCNANNSYSHGIYRSTDGGDTWELSNFDPVNVSFGGLGDNFQIFKIAYHPSIPNMIFVGTSKGIYRSTDNLQTWTRQITAGDITDIAFHPTDPSIIYIVDTYYWSNNLNYAMRSTDTGSSWNQSSLISGNSGNRSVHLSVSTACDNCLYFASDNGVWRSDDEGQNFTFLSNPDESCGGFAVNDLDTSLMIYGYVDIEASADGGQTFEDITWWSLGNGNHGTGSYTEKLNNSGHYVHADLHPAKCVNGVFYVGTDGLFCRSYNNGTTWNIIGQGIAVRENYKLGVSQSNHYRSISGSQDNGTSIRHKDNWIEFYGADGMEGIIHPLNDDWMIGSVQYGSRRRTKDGGQSQDGASPAGQSGSGNAGWEAPLTYNPNHQMTIYNYSDSIFVSKNFGSDWEFLSKPNGTSGNIDQAAIAENNSNIMVVSDGSAIVKSTDGGLTFTSIYPGLPNFTIEDIAFDPNDDETIVVVYASYQNDGQKVFITQDGGSSWSNITYNLEDMPIHTVVIDHTNASNIYLGGEIGVYSKSMADVSWDLYNPGLPNTSIEELEIVYGSNSIKAATWGRGLWEFTLIDRANYPRILTTQITDPPTNYDPKASILQYVTSVISYDENLSSVYLEWSSDSPTFGNVINMTNTQDSTWVSDLALPGFGEGTEMYFKVFAVGINGDTTETYKFMYTVQPYGYPESSGSTDYDGNVTRVAFNTINNFSGKTAPYTDYSSTYSTVVYTGSSHDLTVHLNTDNGNYSYYAKAWIDWNGDTDFTDGNEAFELGAATNVSDGPTDLSPFTISIPTDATPGVTRMRVSCMYNYYPEADAAGFDGEVEDYEIVIMDTLSGIVDMSKNFLVKAYPNPTSNLVNISLSSLQQFVNIRVFNAVGELVYLRDENAVRQFEIDLSDVANGLLLVVLTSDDAIHTFQIIKA